MAKDKVILAYESVKVTVIQIRTALGPFYASCVQAEVQNPFLDAVGKVWKDETTATSLENAFLANQH